MNDPNRAPIERMAGAIGAGRRRPVWPIALTVAAVVALATTAALGQVDRLPPTALTSGPGTSNGAASSDVVGRGGESTGESTPVDDTAEADRAVEELPGATGTVVPPGSARLVAQAAVRVIDTRDGDPAPGGGSLVFRVADAGNVTAIVASVTVMGADEAGSVLLDGGGGVVEAARLPSPGATTTNLVTVPIDGGDVAVRSTAGGAVVVDVVGRFEPVDGPVAAGRFVPVAPIVVAELETATDGRELDLALDEPEPAEPEPDEAEPDEPALDADTLAQLTTGRRELRNASAVLAVITADVGADGGVVRLGPSPDAYDQMLMWAPTTGDDRVRRSLVLLEPNDERLAALRYEGGARLTVEVVGYFTGAGAAAARSGLFVSSGPRPIHDGALAADVPVTVRGLRTDSAVALLTLAPRAGIPGQLGATAVAIENGAVSIVAPAEVDATVILLGEFLA